MTGDSKLTLDRPKDGHSRTNRFEIGGDAETGSVKMKNKTMAIAAVAAFVILSALLLPAVDIDARDGDSEGNAKYIIGTSAKGVELGAGKTARMSFNNTAFTDAATVTFQAKGYDDYQDVTLGTTPVLLDTADIKIQIEGGSGVYSVTFTPGTAPKAGTVYIKMTVTESKNGQTLAQNYFYAANFSTEFSDPKIVVYKNNSSTEEYYSQITGGTVTTLDLAYNTPYSMKLKTMVAEGASWKDANDFLFYGTGLPEGFAVTIDGRIGGKIASTVGEGQAGTMTIHAVMGGIDKTLEIPWKVGQKPITTGADFEIKYDGATVGTYVMIEAADTPTFTLEAVADKGTITDAKFVVGTTEQTKTTEWNYTVSFPGTGTYMVTATCTMEFDGVSMKVEKSFTVYCVSAIYDGDLNPVVTAP